MTDGGDEDMNWTDRRRRFRAILKAGRCYHPASVFDPLSARIAQDLGFEVGMFAGSTASLTVLGAPDLIVLTLSEFAEQAYRINRAFGPGGGLTSTEEGVGKMRAALAARQDPDLVIVGRTIAMGSTSTEDALA